MVVINYKTTLAETTDTISSIKQEIKAEEVKQNMASKTAIFAREQGGYENSNIITNAQGTWKSAEDKKQYLLARLKELENKKVYVGSFKLTGYCPCYKCSSHWGKQTSSGKTAVEGITVAADTRVLPLGSKVFIEGVGERIVQDTGGAIKGNKIDIFVNIHSNAYKSEYNRKNVNLWLVNSDT